MTTPQQNPQRFLAMTKAAGTPADADAILGSQHPLETPGGPTATPAPLKANAGRYVAMQSARK